MKKPEERIQEALWTVIAAEIEPVISTVLESRQSKEKRAKLLRESFRALYKAGVCRGYDLGFNVFGDGDDDNDRSSDVDDNGEPV